MEFLQVVPPVVNTPEWLARVLPTARSVMGETAVAEISPVTGYDDVSEFINNAGGAYLFLGCQDVEWTPLGPAAIPGGRGFWINHNPHFCVDESVVVTGVRLHCRMAVDYLTGVI